MAEDRDEADRTEEPTQRRLEQARERGQVPAAREPGHVLVLGSGLLLAVVAGSWSVDRLVGSLRAALAAAGRSSGAGEALTALGDALLVLLVWLAAPLAAAIAAPALQGGIVWTATPLAPKLERISPLAGARRLFSGSTLLELAKGLLKLAIVAVAAVLVLLPLADRAEGLAELGPVQLLDVLAAAAVRLAGLVLAALLVLAAVDWVWQRLQHLRQLRMTRQEVKEELRDSEGDPLVKQRLRQLRLERARRRMMAEVPKATVVVTNPTHYAVALRYEAATMAAPVLVAKGVDHVALTIRDLARRHGVPVVENPPLARALHAALEPGQSVPPAHYQAVAELIAYVWRLAHTRGDGRPG